MNNQFDCIAVTDVKVFPFKCSPNANIRVMCPITRQLREHIENVVLEKYQEVVNG